MDFRDLKKYTDKIIEKFDHSMINEIKPFDRINPTAENLARYIFKQLKDRILPAQLIYVEVSESEEYSAEYREQ